MNSYIKKNLNGMIAASLFTFTKHSRIKPMLKDIVNAMKNDAKFVIHPNVIIKFPKESITKIMEMHDVIFPDEYQIGDAILRLYDFLMHSADIQAVKIEKKRLSQLQEIPSDLSSGTGTSNDSEESESEDELAEAAGKNKPKMSKDEIKDYIRTLCNNIRWDKLPISCIIIYNLYLFIYLLVYIFIHLSYIYIYILIYIIKYLNLFIYRYYAEFLT